MYQISLLSAFLHSELQRSPYQVPDSFFLTASTNQNNCDEIACKGNSPVKESCWDLEADSYAEGGGEAEVSKQPHQETGRTRGKKEWFSPQETVRRARVGRWC